MLKKSLVAITLLLAATTATVAAEPAKQLPAAQAAAAPAAQPAAASTVKSAVAAPAAQAATPSAAAVTAKALVPGAALTPAKAGAPAKVKPNRAITLTMFLAIIGVTLCVVVWAAKRTTSAADFYAAGGGITGFQNGWAIAGDYMSAASFLGMSGLISLYGIDGFMYAVGPMFSFIAILLVVAEPCRNAGRYTLGDILSFRAAPRTVRAVAALSTVTVS
ncbi:sodium:solute symporter family transporter, partial [Geomonas sp.]|uniref:sodium:solute symporter family transporter n=1 Tax=Geomonas sp. TaxID=2651584 RepID=UPI002BDA46C0|nr:cation acetate symporter [Geomonas sp.]